MSWGSKAEVLEPESLREEIRVDAERVVDYYEKALGQKGKPLTA